MKPQPRIAAPLGIVAVLALTTATGCSAPGVVGSELRPSPTAAGFPVAINAPGDDYARPPKGCRGGSEGGTGALWVLEFWEAGKLKPKQWVHPWRSWATRLEMAPAAAAPLDCRVRVLDNWRISMAFERDGQLLASELLQFVEPCAYSSKDAQGNLFRFYRKRP